MKYVSYFILIFIFYFIISNYISANYVIPNEAIRVRVIANSNDQYDQEVKQKVKKILTNNLYESLKNTKKIDDARNIIKKDMSILNSDIDNYFKSINYNKGYNINFGYNYFPKKIYKGIEYKEGNYESLVVKIGEAKGDNWWCVLFPPICMIEGEKSDKIEYTTLVKHLVDKYF